MAKIQSTLLLMLVSVCLNAQSTVSQISGTVKDSSGAMLPGVDVKVTQTDTGAERTVITNEVGGYIIPNLQVGPYRLEAALQGFTTYVQSGIVLQVNSNPAIHVTLKVGSISEIVEVQADASMVETQTTGIGQVIDHQRVLELPLNGRDVSQLIALSGAAVVGGGGLRSNLNHADAVAYSVGGGLINATNYVLDGGNHVDPRTNVGMPLPFPDAMQEFKVETSALPANYGSQPGGAVNVVTKSGTNSLHGDAFWFLRNGAMNARNFFAPVRDSLKRNQFGGTIGGPLVRDKLFFFGGVQRTTLRTAPQTSFSFVPTAKVLQGDFREILAIPCKTRQINLPATLGGVPFANNNVINPALLDPVALKYIARIPVATDPCGQIRYAIPDRTDAYQIIGKIDWRRNSADQIFVRYYITDTFQKAELDPQNLLANRLGLPNRVQSIIIGDTYVLNPSIVSSARLTYSRSAVQRIGAEGIPTYQELGARFAAPIKNYTGQGGPNGYFGGSGIPGYVYTNVYGISEDLAITRGSHQISIGGEWIQTQMNALGPFQMNPRLTFNGQITGDALADYMTGKLFTLLQGGGQVGREVRNAPAAFIQDNWKVTPRFQANLGLRWDPFIPHYSRYGYAARFDPARFAAKQRSKVFVNAPAGVTFIGDDGFDGKSSTDPKYALFSPRVGLVLDPRGKGTESIRAGYGIFFGSNYLWSTMHVPLNPPWGNTITVNQPAGGLSDPWREYPGGNPFPAPTRFPSNFVFPVGGTFKFESNDNKQTYVQQWNLSVQRQFGMDWLASVAYMGNKTTHQLLGVELNPAVYVPGNCVAGQYGLTAPGPCSTAANVNSRRILTMADSDSGRLFGTLQMTDPNGNASYNGLLLTVNRRFSGNFSTLANYTWSHCLNQGEPGQDIGNFYQNPNDRRAEWGNCSTDRRQLVNVSMVARSPKFATPWTERLLGSWGLSGIFTYSSGSSLTPSTGRDNYLGGFGNQRPDVVGEARVDNPTLTRWFNTEAFRLNAAGTFGNAARSVGLYGPSQWNMDTSLSRAFRLTETTRLDFRFEAFNVLNHARFNNPNTGMNSNDFGKITSALDPRILQLATKIVF